MAIVEERAVGPAGTDVHWGAVIAGAIAAAALAFVLLGFGAGLGLAVSSASPTWRDASFALWFLSGIYLIFVALLSFGFGGYVAGRMRSRLTSVAGSDEAGFRDGMHGLLAWALADRDCRGAGVGSGGRCSTSGGAWQRRRWSFDLCCRRRYPRLRARPAVPLRQALARG